jgi:hypothetical protein
MRAAGHLEHTHEKRREEKRREEKRREETETVSLPITECDKCCDQPIARIYY